jgi:PAS domain S-box-containing protein
MIDSFKWLFSSENFMPHGHCFLWQPDTLWLNVGSDGLIAIAYFAIPVTIYSFTRQRKTQIRYSWVPMTFAAFILLCGATHLMEIWTVWNPVYRAAGALKLVTGLVSLATSLSLIWVLPRVMLLKTPLQLETEVHERTQDLLDANRQLRAQIAARDQAEQQLQIAEEARAQANALLQTIIESAPALIYAKDRHGRMLLANPPALKLIGKTWPEVKGRTDLEFLDDRSQAEAITGNDLRLMGANRTEELEEIVGVGNGEERVWFSIKAPLRDAQGAVTGLVGVSVEITERKRLEQRLRLMVDELNHRVKNTLATVQAIAMRTLRGEANRDLYNAFQNRLRALAAAHDVLTREKWTGAEIYEISAGQLVPLAGPIGARIRLSGPSLRLSTKASLALAMGLHELAINALKYGALSNEAGQVLIDWEVIPADRSPLLKLTWTERQGPPVSPPTQTGFGAQLIERILARDVAGVVRLDFNDPRGVCCTIETPLASVIAPAQVIAFPHLEAVSGKTL